MFCWRDRDSAELLHYVARTFDRGPLLVLLLARGGELSDNEAVQILFGLPVAVVVLQVPFLLFIAVMAFLALRHERHRCYTTPPPHRQNQHRQDRVADQVHAS